jgi:hypothetical protein
MEIMSLKEAFVACFIEQSSLNKVAETTKILSAKYEENHENSFMKHRFFLA